MGVWRGLAYLIMTGHNEMAAFMPTLCFMPLLQFVKSGKRNVARIAAIVAL